MLSGIGPAQHLRSHGIVPVADLPVGENLQNHVKTALLWRRLPPGSPFHRFMRVDRVAPAVLQALLFGTGPATALPFPVQGFVATGEPFDVPDLEFIVRNAPASAAPWFPLLRKPYIDAFGIDPLLLHPESRGTVRLRSADPEVTPEITIDSSAYRPTCGRCATASGAPERSASGLSWTRTAARNSCRGSPCRAMRRWTLTFARVQPA